MLTDDAPARRTAPSASRRLDIQGLRAVAVILVVAFHSRLPISGGFIGVDVFLVISGFVIMGMLMRELQRTRTIRFRNFYTRRIKRLLPALALLTTVVAALSIFLGSSFGSQQTTARTGLGATYFSANVVIYRDSIGYFTPEAETNPLLHTWTLSVEEQVYLVFPALLLGSWVVLLRRRSESSEPRPASRGGRRSLRTSKRSAGVMLTLVAVASFLLSVLASFGWLSSPPQFAFYSSVTRIWEFAIGAGLALAAPSLERISPRIATLMGVAGACAIGVGAFTITGLTPYPGFAVLLPVLGAAAVITGGFAASALVPRLLATKPMVKIGDVSYSWYLWHWPLIVFAAILWPSSRWLLAVIGAISIVPAWLSTVFLEDPIRRSEAMKGRRVLVLAAICTVVPTLAFLGLAAGARTSWGNEQVAQMQTQIGAKHAAETSHCDDAASSGTSIDEAGCQFNASADGPQRGPHVYLVGNSVAAMYSEALIGASDSLDVPLTIDTSHGCFFSGQGDRECSDNFTATIDKLVQRTGGVVVMSSTWDLGLYGGDPDPSGKMTTPRQKVQFLISSLTEAIDRLREAGNHVIIVLPTPRFFYGATAGTFSATPQEALAVRSDAHSTSWRPEDCPTVVAQSDPAACGATVPQAEEDAAQMRTLDALKKVAKATGSATLDLRDRFCPEGVCRTNVGDRWLYRDGIHISVAESESLAPVFARLLKQVIRENWGPSPSPTPIQSSGPRPG